jgi:hypothetical protein
LEVAGPGSFFALVLLAASILAPLPVCIGLASGRGLRWMVRRWLRYTTSTVA